MLEMLEQLIAGETSIKNLSKKLGLSERQVRYALKKLEKERKISYTFLLDYYFYPLEFVALFEHSEFEIDMTMRGRITDFALAMPKLKHNVAIDEFSYGFGAYNAMMHGYTVSENELRKFLDFIYSGEPEVFFIKNAIIKNFAPARAFKGCKKTEKIHKVLYAIINNPKHIKKIARNTGLKESQIRYIIKKLRKSNMGRYYIRVNMEEIYPVEFLCLTKDIVSKRNTTLVKDLLIGSDVAIIHGFAKNVKEIGKFFAGKVMVVVEKVIDNFVIKEVYI